MPTPKRLGIFAVVCALAAFGVLATGAQAAPKPPATPRIYVFENGAIKGLDPALFHFKREELKEVDFVGNSYLIVHPRGTLMFDSGQMCRLALMQCLARVRALAIE